MDENVVTLGEAASDVVERLQPNKRGRYDPYTETVTIGVADFQNLLAERARLINGLTEIAALSRDHYAWKPLAVKAKQIAFDVLLGCR